MNITFGQKINVGRTWRQLSFNNLDRLVKPFGYQVPPDNKVNRGHRKEHSGRVKTFFNVTNPDYETKEFTVSLLVSQLKGQQKTPKSQEDWMIRDLVKGGYIEPLPDQNKGGRFNLLG